MIKNFKKSNSKISSFINLSKSKKINKNEIKSNPNSNNFKNKNFKEYKNFNNNKLNFNKLKGNLKYTKKLSNNFSKDKKPSIKKNFNK